MGYFLIDVWLVKKRYLFWSLGNFEFLGFAKICNQKIPFNIASPTKNKGKATTTACKSIYDELTEAGITPILQYLDNETPKELIAAIKKNNLKFQLAALHDHRLNPAERAVSTFKNHFIAILVECDKRFPKYLWGQLIPPAVITLNILQQSRTNSKLLAHDQVFGTFNYQRTP